LTSGTQKRTETNFRKAIYEEIRPWGKFRCYPSGNTGNLKIITVKPGRALSLQYHRRRSAFWVLLEEIYIPRRTAHRLRCVGRRPGRVLEVWIGRSSERDIVRIEDDFGRVT
jgi:mannose-6-phosphate isomerase-like protein (cupin superfamily)